MLILIHGDWTENIFMLFFCFETTDLCAGCYGKAQPCEVCFIALILWLRKLNLRLNNVPGSVRLDADQSLIPKPNTLNHSAIVATTLQIFSLVWWVTIVKVATTTTTKIKQQKILLPSIPSSIFPTNIYWIFIICAKHWWVLLPGS